MRRFLGRRIFGVGLAGLLVVPLCGWLGVSAFNHVRTAMNRTRAPNLLRQLGIAAVAVSPMPFDFEVRLVVADDVGGKWVSDIRATNRGLMRFEFVFSSIDSTLEYVGIRTGGDIDSEFRRRGFFELLEHQLVSPVLNEGRPVFVWFEGDVLVLWFDGDFEFRLLRE